MLNVSKVTVPTQTSFGGWLKVERNIVIFLVTGKNITQTVETSGMGVCNLIGKT